MIRALALVLVAASLARVLARAARADLRDYLDGRHDRTPCGDSGVA